MHPFVVSTAPASTVPERSEQLRALILFYALATRVNYVSLKNHVVDAFLDILEYSDRSP